ncbi:MAG TPA: heavy metal-binding domain-containing protein [Verrucomicrobiales bacterium]|nr:heavy metal-binding domain-containing protein [Verrucomicrobiales bacterium]
MGQLIIVIVLIGLGYVVGSIAEKKHYRSIISREAQWLHIPTVSVKNMIEDDVDIIDARMVQGSVVISIDHFKRILASLRNIFGGRVTAYESLIDRARREAILRMKEESPNADIILNTRIETSTIGRSANSRKSIGSIEAMAYGTAISYRK